MASPLQRRLKDREDGLALSVRQLVRVKRRINLLAAQQLAFSSLGLLIGAGGLLVIAAFLLSTSHFLALGVLLAVLLLTLLPLVAIRAWRRFAGLERAAAIVDQKAELNGRLSTILALAEKEGDKTLWPFLVEDTVGRLDDFQPNRIEKHRISRSIYGFVAACLIASLAGLMTYSARRNQEALRKFLKNFTLQVDPSEIAPSDNPSDGGTQVEADPETLRSLAERLEAANQNSHGGNRSAMDQLAHKAKDLASNLQDRLTGRQLRDTPEKVKIRLAEAMGDRPPENNESGDSNPSPEKGWTFIVQPRSRKVGPQAQPRGSAAGRQQHGRRFRRSEPAAQLALGKSLRTLAVRRVLEQAMSRLPASTPGPAPTPAVRPPAAAATPTI